MDTIDNKTKGVAIGLLVWLKTFYGNEVGKTYREIAEDYGQCGYGGIRLYLFELRDAGYVTFKRRGRSGHTFVIDEEKYWKLVKGNN